jgi:hypothetical protein
MATYFALFNDQTELNPRNEAKPAVEAQRRRTYGFLSVRVSEGQPSNLA